LRLAVFVVGGKGKTPWADAAVDDYARRVKRYVAIEEVLIRSEPWRGDTEAVRRTEAERVGKALQERDRSVVLDERGEDVDTPTLTRWVEQWRQDGTHRVVFAIGGAYGHDASLRARADRVVRVSSMVLNHEIARVVLYEQLYRVHAAIAGVPYAH
jgi:23S rRNA (pseudouridine1915-N3)-methyltransferase